MERLDALDVDVSDNADEIEAAFASKGGKSECGKSQIAMQNNVANIPTTSESNVCDDDYNIGFQKIVVMLRGVYIFITN